MKKHIRLLVNFIIIFMLIAFVVTCNFILFMKAIDFKEAEIVKAAPVTFINVVFMSALFAIFDIIRRKWTIDRQVAKIEDVIRHIMQGDYRVHVDSSGLGINKDFQTILSGLNKMSEELSGVETLRTDFISNVSHEMKTPLTVIQNYGTLLQTPDLPEEKRCEYAKAINEQTRRLSTLITNILKLNKLENQQIFPNNERFDLGEQLCESMLSFENAWEEKALEIEADIAEGVIIAADRELLSLVWNNLISNAIKFTEKGGTVGISLTQEEEYAVVKIKDTGCGMNPETGKNIFKKFYQGDTSHATQGNGLGLALVKRVIDIMKAEISVSSRLGEGSTFTVKVKTERRNL